MRRHGLIGAFREDSVDQREFTASIQVFQDGSRIGAVHGNGT